MKSYFRTANLILLALLVAVFQAAAQAPNHAEDVAAIKSLFDKHMAAFKAGDAAAVAAFFTDDGVMMPPDRSALMGKDAIQWGLNIAFDLFAAQITGEVLEVEIAGDWAFTRRTYAMMVTAKTGGEEMEVNATWLEILKRQPDGSWKVYREMVNSDRPLPDPDE